MQVILKEDVKSLGKMGDIVNVKDGYARNYLIPKGIAVIADTRNIKALEHEKRKIQEAARRARASAEELASRLSSVKIVIGAKAGEEGKLFGSITAMDIADALKKEGFDIDKKKISLGEPIKRIGSYSVSIKVHPDVSSQINVDVVSQD